MTTLYTDRLRLRPPGLADAAFLLRLLNDPDWLRCIGDRGVHTAADAGRYIEERLLPSFAEHGFGLWVVEPRDGGPALGLCGLLKRDALDDVDIGYGFLPEGRGHGYALEAARRVASHAWEAAGLTRLVAITRPENRASARVLERLGLACEGQITPRGYDYVVSLFGARLPLPADRPVSAATSGSPRAAR